MKTWVKASIEELNISETEYGLFGNAADGGRFGDGIISGHSKWVFDKDGDNTGDNKTETETDKTPENGGGTDIAS